MPAQRRRPRVTTADFDADPVYDLLRLGDPEDGLWELTEHGRRIGTLRRAATNARAARWEAWSAQPWARIDNRSYPTRAQAALALLLEHRNRAAHTRPPNPPPHHRESLTPDTALTHDPNQARDRRRGPKLVANRWSLRAGRRQLIATDAPWRHNPDTPVGVRVCLRGRPRNGIGAVLTDPAEVGAAWTLLLRRRPILGRLSGIGIGDDGQLDPVTLAATEWCVLEIRLDQTPTDPMPADRSVAGRDGDLSGLVAVVTGATSGIGAATALALATRGAQVTIVGRDAERGRELATRPADRAVGRAGRGSATGSGEIRFVLGDLSTTGGVRAVATILARAHPRIDVLVHSAGGHLMRRARNVDGVEVNFATNYLSKFLLTELLLPQLSAASEVAGQGARVVVVGSPVVAPRRLLRLDVATGERTVTPLRALLSSGTATAVWTAELARRLAGPR